MQLSRPIATWRYPPPPVATKGEAWPPRASVGRLEPARRSYALERRSRTCRHRTRAAAVTRRVRGARHRGAQRDRDGLTPSASPHHTPRPSPRPRSSGRAAQDRRAARETADRPRTTGSCVGSKHHYPKDNARARNSYTPGGGRDERAGGMNAAATTPACYQDLFVSAVRRSWIARACVISTPLGVMPSSIAISA